MSIYCTLWEIKLPRGHAFDEEWVEVFAQGVPPHIGHPSEYPEGDSYADFLPPVVDYDPESDEEYGPSSYRAVVILQKGRDRKDVQRYVDPLLVFTGAEYARIPFEDLLQRIQQAIGWDENVFGMFISPEGQKKVLRAQKNKEDPERN